MDSQLIANGISSLADGIRNNTWPEEFFTGVLGMDGGAADRVPGIMRAYLILYFAAAVVAVILHFVKKRNPSQISAENLRISYLPSCPPSESGLL